MNFLSCSSYRKPREREREKEREGGQSLDSIRRKVASSPKLGFDLHATESIFAFINTFALVARQFTFIHTFQETRVLGKEYSLQEFAKNLRSTFRQGFRHFYC